MMEMLNFIIYWNYNILSSKILEFRKVRISRSIAIQAKYNNMKVKIEFEL